MTAAESGGWVIANHARASPEDFRDAVGAARSAQKSWAKQSAYLRGQILYRAAEMLEMRRPGLEAELLRAAGKRNGQTGEEAILTIERLIHLCGLDGQVQPDLQRSEPGREFAF